MFRSLQKETILNCRWGRIIWVAEDEKIVFSIQSPAKIIYIENKVILFAQVVVFLSASGEGEFPGVFWIGRTQDKGMLWISFLYQQCDQFAGTISGQDEFGRNITIFWNCAAKWSIISVWIRGQDIQPPCKLLSQYHFHEKPFLLLTYNIPHFYII